MAMPAVEVGSRNKAIPDRAISIHNFASGFFYISIIESPEGIKWELGFACF